MPCYEIKWREVYEMRAVIEAPTYEAAAMAGADLMNNASSLDFFEDWNSDDAITYTDVDGTKVETDLADKQNFTCLPLPGIQESDQEKEE
jgi:hypothetical protein